MKAAIASLLLVVSAGTVRGSEPDRPSLPETKQDSVSVVRGAMRKLKVGMPKREVMKAFSDATLLHAGGYASFHSVDNYKLDDTHCLVLVFNRGDDSLLRAQLVRGKEVIASVEK